jgi:predicted nucleic acid-binding protein
MNGISTAVLDTNAAISILNDGVFSKRLDEAFPRNIRVISVITQIELLGYPGITEKAETAIRSFLSEIPIISIESDIVELAIQIRRVKPSLKLPDAVIAVTAIDFEAILVTNDSDLLKLEFPGFHVMELV